MKISTLYTKNRNFPWVTFAVALCCLIITVPSVIFPSLYKSLLWSNHPTYPWQYLSGAFLHGDNSGYAMAIMHLVANYLLFVPYAVMLEKLLGHKKFGIIFLITWFGISAVFQILTFITVPAGETGYGNGLSGSAYAVTVPGAFVLFRVFLKNKGYFFKQPLAYVFINGLIGIIIFLYPGFTNIASTIIHLSGLGIGIIITFIYRKQLISVIDVYA